MSDKYSELEALADAATSGPWRQHESSAYRIMASCNGVASVGGDNALDESEHGFNAAYIAAANPAVIKEMIAEIRRLRGALEAIEAKLAKPGKHWVSREDHERALNTIASNQQRVAELESQRDDSRERIKELERDVAAKDEGNWRLFLHSEHLKKTSAELETKLVAVRREVLEVFDDRIESPHSTEARMRGILKRHGIGVDDE